MEFAFQNLMYEEPTQMSASANQILVLEEFKKICFDNNFHYSAPLREEKEEKGEINYPLFLYGIAWMDGRKLCI